MLTGLDQVDWARLSHAHGPATDVPDQIRDLLADEPSVRRRAVNELFGNIYHQGTVYEATAHAVPFLLEVLASPGCQERPHVLALLTAIVTGHDEMWLPGGLPIAENRAMAEGGAAVVAAAPKPGDEDFDEDEGDSEYVYSLSAEDQERYFAHVWVCAYDAVRAGVPLFRELLRSDPPTQCMAAYALAWFPEDAPDSLRALATVTGGDPEGAVAGTATVATGLLGGRPAITLDDPRPVALGCGGRAGEPRRAGRGPGRRRRAGRGGRWRAPGERPVPFLEGDLARYAAQALAQLGDRHAERTFEALLDRVPDVSGTAAFGMVEVALRLAFPERPAERPGYAALDDRQRRLVDALARSPGAWLVDGVRFGNFGALVNSYRLPPSNEEMRDYASTR
ncbi:hypothetical protein BBK82_26815 [Lentzea guizhouensis]|uniref:HEAT repeat domain-containing protein n=1 Tax=Lentzea guizhouensis TaxID=1586287 RepID=A0A1B2HN38_9PSEU|nr:hypothetical protein [Lentzea guizhouensis]ANZ39147.1 hypothetical protein BBK82_26815 [Lentzea guizhouensis]